MGNNTTQDYTTVAIRRSTKKRLEGLRPYRSLSWDEFIGELADTYAEGDK